VQVDDSRAAVLAGGDESGQVADELAAEWRGRLRRLLAADPAAAAELRRLLDEELGPELRGSGSSRTEITMRAKVSGRGRAYQAGRDMNITER
jgi:hypothetical protein